MPHDKPYYNLMEFNTSQPRMNALFQWSRRLVAGLALALFFSGHLIVGSASALSLDVSLESGASESDLSSECESVSSSGLGGALGCESQDKVVDLTQFDGSLEGPDASGYDEALVKTTNARDFIQTIVNYALSFLGLAATVMVIYGGILYVTSRGDEEQTGKAKKTIEYSITGIVIILGSFALINTVINATGGGASTGELGSGSNGVTVEEAGAAFDLDGVLNQLEALVTDYQNARTTYQSISSELNYLASLEVPFTMTTTVTDATVSGYLDYASEWLSGEDSSMSDTVELVDESYVKSYLSEMRKGIQSIQNKVDPNSDAYEQAQDFYDFLRSGSNGLTVGLPEEEKKKLFALVPSAEAATNISGLLDAMKAKGITPGSCLDGPSSVDFSAQDSQSAVGNLTQDDKNSSKSDKKDTTDFGNVSYDSSLTPLDGVTTVCADLASMYSAALADYEGTLERLQDGIVGDLVLLFGAPESLGDLATTASTATDGSSLSYIIGRVLLVKGALAGEITEVSSILSNGISTDSDMEAVGNAADFRKLLAYVDELYTAVQNLQFVDVRLKASVAEANVPVKIRFDALGSLDPTGQTVQDSQITWDLDGDGQFNDGTGDSVVGTYGIEDVGTVRARVKVTSSSSEVAAGLATLNVILKPPRSQIYLTALLSSESTLRVLADYRAVVNQPRIDEESFKVTMAEGKAGIEFSACDSLDGDDNPLSKISWDFGDNETAAGDFASYCRQPHSYGTPGTYDVSMVVTDDTGVQDQKFFRLYVASPAARITVYKSVLAVGEEFTLDGSASSTDIGTIVSYLWKITKDGVEVPLTNAQERVLTTTFTEPGIYTVTLTVADGTAKKDTVTTDLTVESQAPIATYTYKRPDASNPAVLDFDGTESHDPDEGDTLTYAWTLEGTEGRDYKIITGSLTQATFSIRYLVKGDYDVTLTVKDQYTNELQKTDSITGTVTVDNLLDVKLEIDGQNARHLDGEGKAEVQLNAFSDNATAFEMDYGDGNTDFTETIARGESIFTHTYEQAGVFTVTLTALDDENNKNTTSKRLYVAAGDTPIAVMNISASEDLGSGASLQGNVKTRFSFDAGDSINKDGTKNNLLYSWNFGDGTTSGQRTATHVFEERATYTVTLTVKDSKNTALSNDASIQIKIDGIAPNIRGLSIVPTGDQLVTPLKVNVTVDASDEDGKITYVKAWYYDMEDSAEALGVVVAQSSSFTLTLNTKGKEGETVTYGFAAEVTDDSNTTVSTLDELPASEVPSLTVTNGPNDTPVANFSVDHSSVMIGEEVVFASSAYDPDGKILYYTWDIEGDGFYNNDPQTEASFTHAFSQVNSEGISVQLKVEDDAGATATSEKIKIYVDAVSDPPVAKFLSDIESTKVTFRNNSFIDEAKGAKLQGLYWDADLSFDSDGDGTPSNDFDSYEASFTHDYGKLGTYKASLTVVDSTGQIDTVTQDIQVINAKDPVAEFTYTVDGKNVQFKNSSTTDIEQGVDVRSYTWDFNTETNLDISNKKSPSFEYADYGEYQVSLTVEDTLGKKVTSTKFVDVKSPIQPVVASFTSVPQPNSLKQVILTGDQADVSFYFSASGGNGEFEYTIDKNIFYDTDGDGVRDNDVDYKTQESGSWKSTFYKSYGQIVTKLTATDKETGEKNAASLQVVFQGSNGGANLLNATPSTMVLLLFSALAVACLGIFMVHRHS